MTNYSLLSNEELNQLIAEKVLGLHVQHSGALGGYWIGSSIKEGYQRLPAYSDNFADAMMVVEKMRERGWSFACTLYEGKLPYASFCRRTASSSRNAEAESLPRAICVAALATIDVDPSTSKVVLASQEDHGK